ncbi:hypothetical protein XENOCAPTIV_007022 [Xenoophorus captivus]|uniref:Calponin-homology (CH) domain-containing protein n=1 Tax=Xenoophorus captivus TaxID=1517983 RepID=A0ABV0QYY5_9TELE
MHALVSGSCRLFCAAVVAAVFLRSHKSMESIIESRLKVVLPEDLSTSLMDGVVLCHLANHIRPRSVGSIHVPSPAVVRVVHQGVHLVIKLSYNILYGCSCLFFQPKLSMAKCRRNVENFLDACKKIGVPQVRRALYEVFLCELGIDFMFFFQNLQVGVLI